MVWFDSKLIKWLMPSLERHGEREKKHLKASLPQIFNHIHYHNNFIEFICEAIMAKKTWFWEGNFYICQFSKTFENNGLSKILQCLKVRFVEFYWDSVNMFLVQNSLFRFYQILHLGLATIGSSLAQLKAAWKSGELLITACTRTCK